MRPFNAVVSITFLAIFIALCFSCKKDKCKKVVCENGGICHSGTCICPSGYEGANCSIPWRNKFLGTWTQSGSGAAPAQSFTLTVVADTSGITKVKINNFDNFQNLTVDAFVSTSDSLVIPNQLSSTKIIAEGSAFYNSKTNIGVYYQILDYVSNELDTIVTKWQ